MGLLRKNGGAGTCTGYTTLIAGGGTSGSGWGAGTWIVYATAGQTVRCAWSYNQSGQCGGAIIYKLNFD